MESPPWRAPPPPAVPTDGVLGDTHWSVARTGVAPAEAPDPAPSVVVVCGDTPLSRALYPHPFAAALTLSLMATDDASLHDFDAAVDADARARARKEAEGARDAGGSSDEDAADERPPSTLPPLPPPPLQLRFVLQIQNTGKQPMTFTAGVVAALGLRCPALASIVGTAGRVRFDVPSPGAPPTVGVDESPDPVPLDGLRHLDRLYVGEVPEEAAAAAAAARRPPNAWKTQAPTPRPETTTSRDPWARALGSSLILRTGDLRHEIEAIPRRGFRDVGVRAPAPPPGGLRRSATTVIGEVARVVTLSPGAVFTGEAVVRLHDVTHRATPGDAVANAYTAARPHLRSLADMPPLAMGGARELESASAAADGPMLLDFEDEEEK